LYDAEGTPNITRADACQAQNQQSRTSRAEKAEQHKILPIKTSRGEI